jgi:hypothetical protein
MTNAWSWQSRAGGGARMTRPPIQAAEADSRQSTVVGPSGQYRAVMATGISRI